jgi:CheY-like chemotaxis protein
LTHLFPDGRDAERTAFPPAGGFHTLRPALQRQAGIRVSVFPELTAFTMDSDINLQASRVLIADDIPQNRELLEAYLASEGYTILVAGDGQETMQMVDRHQPDLILLDIMMPRMSGYEVCVQIKSDPARRNIPVLIVTALNESGDIEKAVNAGCDDFLTKPVNGLELRTRVRSLLRVRHLTNERDRLLAYLAEMEQRVLRGQD